MAEDPLSKVPAGTSSVTVISGVIKEIQKIINKGNKQEDDEKQKGKSKRSDPADTSTRTSVHKQEFLWDSIIQWLVAAIFGLSLLDVSANFFRNYTVSCHVETDLRDEAAYVNNYCYGSLPRSEYFTLYVIIHGFLIIGPHILWKTVSDSYINYFFDLCNGLDRLRDRLTGDYDPRNSDIVSRLVSEFQTQSYIDIWNWKVPLLFGSYILKLVIQLIVSAGSILFSATYFYNFPEVFPCPKNLDPNSYGWHLNTTVTCVFPSIHFMALLQYGDFILLGITILVLAYAFIWVIQCHPKELGQSKIAEICSQSCLIPNDYTYTYAKYIRPRYDAIRNDMDFLLMMLFRASSGKGATLKEMLMKDMMGQHYSKDDELLQLFLEQRDEEEDVTQLFKQARFRAIIRKIGTGGSPRYIIESKLKPKLGLTDDKEKPPNSKEISKLVESSGRITVGIDNFLESLYTEIDEDFNPIHEIHAPPSCNCCVCINCYNHTSDEKKRFTRELHNWCKRGGRRGHLRKVLEEHDLESLAKDCIGEPVSKKDLESFQNRVYSFLQLVKPHQEGKKRLLAMDISFDGLGCTYILEWAIESVCSISFNSHFHNQSEPVKNDMLYNQITLIRLPQDFFSLPGTDQTKLFEYLDKVYFDSPKQTPRAVRRRGINDEEDRYINFFTVGPMKEDARRVTVNLLLERLYRGTDIADNCLMLAIRPLMIGGNVVADKYVKYVPSYSLFRRYGTGKPRPQRSRTTMSLPGPAVTNERLRGSHRQMSLPVESQPLLMASSPPPLPPTNEEDPREDPNEGIDDIIIEKEAFRTVGLDKGIVCYCAGVECVFEMILYKYIKKQERDDQEQISSRVSSV